MTRKILFLILPLSFLLVSSVFAATDWCASANMKGAWKFEETSGSVIDCTSNGNNGTVTSGTQGVTGKYGNAIDFNQNNNEKLNFGSATSLDDLTQKTLGAWVYPDTDGDNSGGSCNGGVVFHKSEWGFCIQPTDKIRFFHRWNGGQTSWDTTNADVSYGAWHHWAVKYDRGSTTNDPVIWVDGVVKSTNNPNPCCSSANSDGWSNLHSAQNGNDINEFDGKYDEAFYYSGMLTDTDINEIKDSGLDGLQGSTAAYSGRGIARAVGRGMGR